LYGGSGWLPFVDHLRSRLPPGAAIRAWDRARPLVEVVGDVDVILPSNAPISAAVIAAAPKLRLIQQPATGTEGIDREAAIARGIPICNAPGTNHVSVAASSICCSLRRQFHRPDERRIGVPVHRLAGRRSHHRHGRAARSPIARAPSA
jgi:phosphoglycerate dehydrogenase-like enzyme